VHLFALQGQHSANDLKNAGKLRDRPEVYGGIFTGRLFQYIDFPGSSSESINPGAFIGTNPTGELITSGLLATREELPTRRPAAAQTSQSWNSPKKKVKFLPLLSILQYMFVQ
jgi:hypothetical protein